MNSRAKKINGLMAFLILILQTIILIKIVANTFIIWDLLYIDSLNELLSLSESSIFSKEVLFKLALNFSDFDFSWDKLIQSVSLFDILPILIIILSLEINRISKKLKSLSTVLFSIIVIYLLKYIGVLIIVLLVLTQVLKILNALKFIAIWLIFMMIAFLLSIMYLIYAYNIFTTIKDY